MGIFRLVYRLFLTVLWFSFIAIGNLKFLFMKDWNRVQRAVKYASFWARGLAKIMNLKINVIGDPKSFKGGLIVSNHLGYLDILAHGSIFPIRFTPKSDIQKWPLLGSFVNINRPIWIDRNSRQSSKDIFKAFQDTMKNNIQLLVYPEGTSTSGKEGIKPFKSTAFETVLDDNIPILPVLLHYRQPENQPTVCWYGDMAFLPHILQVFKLPSIHVDLHILDPVYPEGRSRKELAKYVHSLMSVKYKEINS